MKLSIFGPRGCGKTTYLTCLYGQGGKVGSFAISARDEATRNYLADRWQQLFTGTELAPTALGTVPLRLVFSANRQAYDIELQDFAGALVMRDKSQDEVKKKLKEALFKSFHESSGVMVFIEAGEPDFQSQFDRRIELDALIEVLHEQEKRELITRPIAIVITKWDKIVASVGQSDQSKEVEAFLRTHYNNLYALLQECSQNVRVFASSAFGFDMHTPDGKINYKKISPFNLEKPFAWIGQTIDELNYRRCELFEKDNPRHLKEALHEYQNFRSHVNAGPHFDKASERIRQLKITLWKKRARQWGIAAAVVLVLVMSGVWAYEKNRRDRMLLALDPQNSQSDPAVVIQDSLRYLAGHHLFANWLGWKKKVQEKLLEFQGLTEQRVFAEIQELYKQRDASKDRNAIEKRIAGYGQFLETYPASERRGTVMNWRQQEESLLRLACADSDWQYLKVAQPADNTDELEQAIKKGQEFLRNYPDSQQTEEVRKKVENWYSHLSKLSSDKEYSQFILSLIQIENPIDYCRHCRDYLTKHPHISFRDKVEEKIKAKDDEVFEDAEQKAKLGKKLKEQTEGYREYVNSRIFREHIDEAKKKWEAIEKKWYEKLRTYASPENFSKGNIEKIALWAREYQEDSYFKTMQDNVSRWLLWYGEIKQGKNLNVTIKSAQLSRNCRIFKGWIGTPDTYVVLTYGSDTIRTSEIVDDWSPDYNKSGSLEWSISDNKTLEIQLWCTDFTDQQCSWSSPDTFLLQYLNQEINIDGNLLKLRCRDAVWPELPAYRNE